jgi:hypothetical protein
MASPAEEKEARIKKKIKNKRATRTEHYKMKTLRRQIPNSTTRNTKFCNYTSWTAIYGMPNHSGWPSMGLDGGINLQQRS